MCRQSLPSFYVPIGSNPSESELSIVPSTADDGVSAPSRRSERPTLPLLDALANDARVRRIDSRLATMFRDHEYNFVYPRLDYPRQVFPRNTDGFLLSLPGSEYIRHATDHSLWWISDVIVTILVLLSQS